MHPHLPTIGQTLFILFWAIVFNWSSRKETYRVLVSGSYQRNIFGGEDLVGASWKTLTVKTRKQFLKYFGFTLALMMTVWCSGLMEFANKALAHN